MRDAPRAALCAILIFHLAAITITNVPRTTALGSTFHRPFDAYLSFTGLWQSWAMFTTIPYYLEVDGSFVAIGADGRQTEYGPMLPGLEPYRKDPAIDVMFLRLGFVSDYAAYGGRYTAALCKAVAERTGTVPAGISFELRTKQLRPMKDVLRDGRIADPHSFKFGPTPCPR